MGYAHNTSYSGAQAQNNFFEGGSIFAIMECLVLSFYARLIKENKVSLSLVVFGQLLI